MARDKVKKKYLRYFKKYRKKHGTVRGAKSYSRYLQAEEPGSSQMRQQMGGLSSSDYAAVRKLRDKRK